MTPRALSDDERLDWLQLSRTRGIGPVTFDQLMSRFDGNAGAALQAIPELTKKSKSPPRPPSRADLENEVQRAQSLDIRYLARCEPDYPEALCVIPDAPQVIALSGDMTGLARPGLAMVGARNASAAGRKIAQTIARDLANAGWCVISGLARGIDGDAHAAALQSGQTGATLAVVAGGIDQIYPPEHRKLQEDILAKGGLIVSERALGHKAVAKDFPRRNRIISGLSRAVLVVEAAKRSGSLITARMALEQGRDVMAVPGSPLDDRTAGSNGLIKQGAWLIETAEDVANAMEGGTNTLMREPSRSRTALQTAPVSVPTSTLDKLRRALSPTPVAINDLIQLVGCSQRDLLAALSELELMGEAQTYANGLASRTSP